MPPTLKARQTPYLAPWMPLLNTDTSGTGASVQLDSLTWNPDPAGGGLWAFSLTVSNGDYEAQSKTITVRTVNNW